MYRVFCKHGSALFRNLMLSGKVLFISAGKFTTRNYPEGGDGKLACDVQSSPCVYPQRGLKPCLATLASLHAQRGHDNRSQEGRQRCWRGPPPCPAAAWGPWRPQQHVLFKGASPATWPPPLLTVLCPAPHLYHPPSLSQGGLSTLGPPVTGELCSQN